MACNCNKGSGGGDLWEPVFADGTVGVQGTADEVERQLAIRGGGFKRKVKAETTR